MYLNSVPLLGLAQYGLTSLLLWPGGFVDFNGGTACVEDVGFSRVALVPLQADKYREGREQANW